MIRIGHPPRRRLDWLDRYLTTLIATALIISALLAAAAG